VTHDINTLTALSSPYGSPIKASMSVESLDAAVHESPESERRESVEAPQEHQQQQPQSPPPSSNPDSTKKEHLMDGLFAESPIK
jgi:hypothetical protein